MTGAKGLTGDRRWNKIDLSHVSAILDSRYTEQENVTTFNIKLRPIRIFVTCTNLQSPV